MLRRPSAAALATIGRGAAAPGRYRSQHSRRALSSVPAAAAASSASSTLNPLVLTQDALAAVHAATGTPWWLVLGGSAIALRVAILPAVLLQVRETRRLMALMPQFAIFRQQTAAIEPAAERARSACRAYDALCEASDSAGALQPSLPSVSSLPVLRAGASRQRGSTVERAIAARIASQLRGTIGGELLSSAPFLKNPELLGGRGVGTPLRPPLPRAQTSDSSGINSHGDDNAQPMARCQTTESETFGAGGLQRGLV